MSLKKPAQQHEVIMGYKPYDPGTKRIPDREKVVINPKAVEFLAVSAPFGSICWVEIGHGPDRIYGEMSVKGVTRLVQDVKTAGKELLSLDPLEECAFEWQRSTAQSQLYIDPAAVVSMNDMPNDTHAHIQFVNAGTLEVNDITPGMVGERKLKMEEWMSRILHANLLLTRVKAENGIYFRPEYIQGVSQSERPQQGQFLLHLHSRNNMLTLRFNSASLREVGAVEVAKRLDPDLIAFRKGMK